MLRSPNCRGRINWKQIDHVRKCPSRPWSADAPIRQQMENVAFHSALPCCGKNDSSPISDRRACIRAACRLLPHGKRHIHPARFGPRILSSSRGDHNELPSVHLVRCRSRVAHEWQRRLPKQRAGRLIKRSKFLVEVRRANQQEATRRHQRPAIIFRTRILHSLGRQVRIFAQRNFPHILAGVQIDRVQCPPGRSYRRVSLRIKKSLVSGKVIFHRRRFTTKSRLGERVWWGRRLRSRNAAQSTAGSSARCIRQQAPDSNIHWGI